MKTVPNDGPEPQTRPNLRHRRAVILIFVIASALRLTPALLGFRPIENPDSVDYRDFGRSLVSGKGYGYVPGSPAGMMASLRNRGSFDGQSWVPTAFRPPGYPLLLCVVYFFGGATGAVFILQGFLGLVTVLMLYRAAREIAPESTALVTAGFAAVYPYFIYFAVEEISECLFITLLAALTFVLLRGNRSLDLRWSVVGGILQGLLILVRPQGFFIAIAGIPLLCTGAGGRRRCRALVLYGSSAAVVLLPWVVRNFITFHEFIPFSTLGGFNFWLGNAYYAEHGTHHTFDWTTLGGTLPEISGMTETQLDRFYYGRAWNYIWRHPGDVLRVYLLKLWDLWRPTPHAGFFPMTYRLLSLGGTLPLYLLSIAAIGRKAFRTPPVLFLFLVLVVSSLLSAFHLPLVRHRVAGLDPIMMILAAVGCGNLLDRWRQFRSRGVVAKL